MKYDIASFIVFIVLLAFSSLFGYAHADIAKGIHLLEKIGEIKETSPADKDNFFWNICDLYYDKKGNLYVADSGWNKIFRFDSEFKFVDSIGRQGQGPGEFSANPRGAPLKIHFGNDGMIYVLDPGLRRLSRFDKNWKFQKSFPLNKSFSDFPLVNSNGDIFLLAWGINNAELIQIFDSESEFKRNFFKAEYHYDYPYSSPPKKMLNMPADDRTLMKFISNDDHIIVLSNYSLTVFHYNQKLNLINKFRIIDSKEFESDFKTKLTKALSFDAFVVPFHAYLDDNDLLYVLYSYDTDRQQEVYKYDLVGQLRSVYRLPEKTDRIFCVNTDGIFFCSVEKKTAISIYK